MGLEIVCYPKGLYGENTYLITDEATGFKAVIDPGYYETDMRMDIQNNAYLKYLLLTHAHHDHFLAVPHYLNEYTGVKFAAPEGDLELLRKAGCPEPSMTLKDGDVIKVTYLIHDGEVANLEVSDEVDDVIDNDEDEIYEEVYVESKVEDNKSNNKNKNLIAPEKKIFDQDIINKDDQNKKDKKIT